MKKICGLVSAAFLLFGTTNSLEAQQCQLNLNPRTCLSVEELGNELDLNDINERGTIVGKNGNSGEAFILDRDGSSETFTVGTSSTNPVAINEDGTMIGSFFDQNTSSFGGFIRTVDGSVARITAEHGSIYLSGISDNGTVVGSIWIPDSSGFPGDNCQIPVRIEPKRGELPYEDEVISFDSPFVCDSSSGNTVSFSTHSMAPNGLFVSGGYGWLSIFDPRFLPVPLRSINTSDGLGLNYNAWVSAINSNGTAVGSFSDDFNPGGYAFRTDASGTIIPIAQNIVNAGAFSAANDINECGDVVGSIQEDFNGPFNLVGFVSTNSGNHLLNSKLCPSASPTLVVREATAINRNGTILASAYDFTTDTYSGVILRPTRAPLPFTKSVREPGPVANFNR